MTSSHHGPYAQGYTRATMAHTECCDLVTGSQSQKERLSSDCRLQLACMKLESLVIAHQQWRGEYVPGPCTHRPSSHGSWEDLKAVTARSCLGLNQRLGLSRNKVAVPEGVAGTPPFWSLCGAIHMKSTDIQPFCGLLSIFHLLGNQKVIAIAHSLMDMQCRLARSEL